MNRLLRYFVAGAAIAFCHVSSAVEFNASISVTRPAWFLDPAVSPGLRDMNNSAGTSVPVPASNQLVMFFQPGDFHPIYCGAAYTDENGSINTLLECGGLLPDRLYAEVIGHSLRGFAVGVFDEDGFWASVIAAGMSGILGTIASGGAGGPAAMAAAAGLASNGGLILLDREPEWYRWITSVRNFPSGQTSINFGTFMIGGGAGPGADNDDWAAAVMEGVDFIYGHTNPNTLPLPVPLPVGYSGYEVSSWTINNPFFGAPSTVWRNVHMHQGWTGNAWDDWGGQMDALAHEYGHVLYNTRHSDQAHYWIDVVEYIKNHDTCNDDFGPRFAFYEGFAEAFSAITWRTHAASQGDSVQYPIPFYNCPNRGLTIEGNVADALSAMFYGVNADDQRDVNMLNAWFATSIAADSVVLPPLPLMINAVSQTRGFGHTLNDNWINYFNAFCGQQQGQPNFCGTRRYHCYVRDELASPGEWVFGGADCSPGISSVSNITTTTPGTSATDSLNNVGLSPADVVDQYTVHVYDSVNSSPPAYSSPPTVSLNVPDVPIPVCSSRHIAVETSNPNGSVEGERQEFLVLNDLQCRPDQSMVVNVSHTGCPVGLLNLFDNADDDDTETTAPCWSHGRFDESCLNEDPFNNGNNNTTDNSGSSTPGGNLPVIAQAWPEFRVEFSEASDAQFYQIRHSTIPNAVNSEAGNWWGFTAGDAHQTGLQTGTTNYIRVATKNSFGITEGPEFVYNAPNSVCQ